MKILLLLFILLTFNITPLAKDVITIVRGDGHWPPYEYVEDGTLKGLHYDLIYKAAENLDMEVDIISYPWARAVSIFQGEKVDAISYIGKTEEREKFGIFLEGNVISVAKIGLLVKKDNSVEYSGNFEELKEYKLGGVIGFTYGAKFNDYQSNLNIEYVRNLDVNLNKLLRNRVDIVLINIDDYNYSFHDSLYYDHFEILENKIDSIKIYLAFSKKNKKYDLAEKFSRELKKIKSSPEYERILKKYNLK